MTSIRKLKTSIETKAEAALEVFQDLKDLNAQLESYKEEFRDHADGETVDIIIQGLGKVQIKKPSEGGTFTSTVFDTKAFEALDKATQHLLISSGVVKITTSSKAASKAAVVFTLNV